MYQLINMPFITGDVPSCSPEHPVFCVILGNTLLSTIPGLSGAGPDPEKTLLTPNLDAELVTTGRITSLPLKPNTPTGCPTPATITRAMAELTGIPPLFINAGLKNRMTVPFIDALGEPGNDPRKGDAVPQAKALYAHGREIGRFLSRASDLLVLGECVPGGTTSALCVLRALGYPASVSSSFVKNPVNNKEALCKEVLVGLAKKPVTDPLEIVGRVGDPMIPVAAGIAESYTGTLVLAGGTQMLAVCSVIKAVNRPLPTIATTIYVKEDRSANVEELVSRIGVRICYVDPSFGTLGHPGLARYCDGEVKEGTGAGGSMCLAYMMGYTPRQIQEKIRATVEAYR
jgi:TIGR00303 family protein